jgi:hypothetical protein
MASSTVEKDPNSSLGPKGNYTPKLEVIEIEPDGVRLAPGEGDRKPPPSVKMHHFQ